MPGRQSNRAELAQRAQATPTPATTGGEQQGQAPRSIYALIEAQKGEIARALPKHMDPDRLARVAITTLRQTPRLLECTPQSLLGALMLSAQLGLEPGPLGHAYLVPFWNSKTKWVDGNGREKSGAYEVTWILGYKGIIDLAQRSGKLISIEAREVCRHDDFTFEYGLEPKLVHKPKIEGDRGEAYAYYGVAHFKDGGRFFLVMSKADVDKRRDRSKAKDNGPWVTDYDAMARKTVIRAMAPFLPLTVELAGAMAHDTTVHREVAEAMVEMPPAPQVIDGEIEAGAVETPEAGTPEGVDAATGEITEPDGAEQPDDGGPTVDEAKQQVLDANAGDKPASDGADTPAEGSWPEQRGETGP